MADLNCQVEIIVSGRVGIAEEVASLNCSGGVEIGGSIWTAIAAVALPLTPAVEIGANLWCELPTIELTPSPGIQVGGELTPETGASLSRTLSCEVETQVSFRGSLETIAIPIVNISLEVRQQTGALMGMTAPKPTPVTLPLTVCVRAEGKMTLTSIMPSSLFTTVLATPVEKLVGGTMNLTAGVQTPAILSGIVTMKVGGSMGLSADFPAAPVVVLLNGGTSVGGSLLPSTDVAKIIETWVLTGNNFNPSFFTGWNFNSFAKFKNKNYAAGPNGIYILEGPDDDGQPIHPGTRLVTNFGTEKHKRLRSIHMGQCGEKSMVRVAGDSGEDVFEPDTHDHRAMISRNLQSQQFVLDFIDFTQLSQLEIVVLPLIKR